MTVTLRAIGELPTWIPAAVRLYLNHTEDGLSLRALARREGCHASTVLRQVRRFENRRDDPLIDEALAVLGRTSATPEPLNDSFSSQCKEAEPMTAPIRQDQLLADEATIAREARRILRRLCELGAVLAIAPDMEKAVVLRSMPDGRTIRTGVMERTVAQAFALKDWIVCRQSGRVAAYEITNVGRSALKRLLADDQDSKGGFAESMTPFGEQHRVWGEKLMPDEAGEAGEQRRMRYNLAESPIALLARR